MFLIALRMGPECAAFGTVVGCGTHDDFLQLPMRLGGTIVNNLTTFVEMERDVRVDEILFHQAAIVAAVGTAGWNDAYRCSRFLDFFHGPIST